MIQELITNLKLPFFPVQSSQIQILKTPQSFYETLLVRARTATRRIVLSTLYIGIGILEKEFVLELEKAVRNRNVRLVILLDATRGLRSRATTMDHAGIGDLGIPQDKEGHFGHDINCSCDLLAPLTALKGVSVLLYHNPTPHKWIRYWLPSRWCEAFGVQHIKAYVFDDSVVMSGANLSHEYFTSRQDRAWLFDNVPSLADFYVGLIDTISKFSTSLQPDRKLKYDFESTSSDHHCRFSLALKNFIQVKYDLNSDIKSLNHVNGSHQTFIIPLIQCGHYGIRLEEKFITQLIHTLLREENMNSLELEFFLASGYFNLTRSYEELLIKLIQIKNQSRIHLLCASPMANGFLNSKGISGFIPLAYRETLINFLGKFRSRISLNQSNRIHIFEYYRPKWTFHVKGVWMNCNSSIVIPHMYSNYCLTLVGSSNFSYRSLNRDLESQLFVWTNDSTVKSLVNEEKNSVFCSSSCERVTLSSLIRQNHYRLPWYLRFMLPLFRLYM